MSEFTLHPFFLPIPFIPVYSRPQQEGQKILLVAPRFGLGNVLRNWVSVFMFALLSGRRIVLFNAGKFHAVYTSTCEAFYCGFDQVRLRSEVAEEEREKERAREGEGARKGKGLGDLDGVKKGRNRRNMAEEEGSRNLQQPVVTLERLGISGLGSIAAAGQRQKTVEDEGSRKQVQASGTIKGHAMDGYHKNEGSADVRIIAPPGSARSNKVEEPRKLKGMDKQRSPPDPAVSGAPESNVSRLLRPGRRSTSNIVISRSSSSSSGGGSSGSGGSSYSSNSSNSSSSGGGSSNSSNSSNSSRGPSRREKKEWKQGDPRHYLWDPADVYTDHEAMLYEFQTTVRHVSITKENARALLAADDSIVFSYGFAYFDHWWRLDRGLSKCVCAAVGGCGVSGLEYRSKAVHALIPGGPRPELGATIERILRRR